VLELVLALYGTARISVLVTTIQPEKRIPPDLSERVGSVLVDFIINAKQGEVVEELLPERNEDTMVKMGLVCFPPTRSTHPDKPTRSTHMLAHIRAETYSRTH